MKNVDKITLYLRSGLAGQTSNMDVLKQALADSGPDAQANARRWVVLGMLTERAGFRAVDGTLILPAGGLVPPAAQPLAPVNYQKPVQSVPGSLPSGFSSLSQTNVSKQADTNTSSDGHSSLMQNLRNL